MLSTIDHGLIVHCGTLFKDGVSKKEYEKSKASLCQIIEEAENVAACMASKPFIEGILAQALKNKEEAEVAMAALRGDVWWNHASPVVIAFDAAMQKKAEILSEVAPEYRRAVMIVYERLTQAM